MRSIDWLTNISNRIRTARVRRAKRKLTGNRFTRVAGHVQSEGPRAQTEGDMREGLWHTFEVAPRFTRDSRRFQRQVWNTSDIAAMTERLEDRTLLAGVSDGGGTTLTIDLAASESLQVVSNGTSYTFTSNQNFTDTGVAEPGDFAGFGATTLTLNDLAQYDTINVIDSGAGATVTFNDSGANSYTETINVTLDDAAAGTITFNGASPFSGSAALDASTTRNIVLNSGSSLTTVNGGITLDANSAGTQTADFIGLNANSATIQATGTGNIHLSGYGSETGMDTTDIFGVYLHSGTSVSSTATGSSAGTITIIGTGGSGTSSNHGVYLLGSTTDVTSKDGAVMITGTSLGTTHSNYGVHLNAIEKVESTGTGADAATITIAGTGADGTSSGHGVYLLGSSTVVTSVDGAIAITGAGGDGTGDNNFGVLLADIETVKSTGTGTNATTVSITGTGGNGAGNSNHGISIQADSDVEVADAALTVTGTAVSGNSNGVRLSEVDGGRLVSIGSGSITITGDGSGLSEDLVASADSVIGDATHVGAGSAATGDITINVDTVTLGGTVSVESDGALTIAPRTASTTIGLGGGAGTLNLDDTELAALADGFSSITIGDAVAGTGTVDVDSSTFSDAVTIVGGSIAVTELNAGSNAVTLTARGGAITDGGDVGADVTGSSLAASATTGVGTGADAIETEMTNLEASGGTGGVNIANTGALTIGGVGALTGVSATGGDITITASSPLTVNEAVTNSGGGNVTLTSAAAAASSGLLYLADDGTDAVRVLDLSTNMATNLVTGQTSVSDVAVDTVNSKIYWVDFTANALRRADLNGSNVENLVTGLTTPRSVALDVAGGKVYWSDTGPSTDFDGGESIKRANLDGTSVETILTAATLGDDPFGISLDLDNGHIYWTQKRTTQVIRRADLDGSNLTNILAGTDGQTDLAVDGASGFIYFTTGSGLIERVDLNGANRTTISTTSSTPRAIALDAAGGVLYFDDDSATGAIDSDNVAGGAGQTVVTLAGANYRGMDFVLVPGGAAADDLTINANVTASGGNGTVTLNAANDVLQTAGTVSAVGSGAVDVNAGTATADGVVTMSSGTALSTATGAITVDADGTATLDSVTSTSGDITVTAGDVVLNNSVSSTGGALTLQPASAGSTVGVGGGTGVFDVGDADIANLADGFSSIVIGDTTSGLIEIDTASFADPLNLITGGEIHDTTGTDLNMTSGDTATASGTVAPGQSPGILTVTGNFAFADNSTYEVEIGGTTPGTANTNHDQIDATGSVTIGTGVTLNTVQFNSFTPTGGETIEIINRTGGSGTFNGLVEGAQVSADFLGSGLAATITYVGGDGDDVVITVETPTTTDVTLVGNVLTVTDAASDNTADDLTISFATDTYTITDNSGSLIDASSIAGSTGNGTATVTVPVGSIDGINFDLLGGDDVVNVTSVQPSLAGGFTISGGTGRDRATINGDIVTTGTGAVDITVSANVLVNSAATISTVNGGITLSGNSGGTTTGILTGVDINGGTVSTSGTGAISLTGVGGTSGDGLGVRVQNGGKVESTATSGGGGITLNGTGKGGDAGGYGVQIKDATTLVDSKSGAIQITGQGGAQASSHGVFLTGGADITSSDGTGAATITVSATGGTGASSAGLIITDAGSTISSIAGAIDITGTGASANDSGIVVSNGTIESLGAATVTIAGTTTTGSGIVMQNAGEIGDATGSGMITLKSDLFDFTGTPVIDGQGALIFEPITAATTIGLGGGTGTLNLTDAELAFLSDGFSSITFGKADAGNIDIDTASFADPVTLLTAAEIHDNAGTDLNMTSGDTATGDGTVAPGQSPGILNVSGNFAFADNSIYQVEIGGTTAGVGAGFHDQIDATGSVTIGTGVTLTPSSFGGFTPAVGESFEIINRTGGTGTFDGLAEGAIISTDFLSSGFPASITYVGGDGDDVVVSIAAPTTDVTLTGNVLTITDAESDNTNDDLTISFAANVYTITDNGGALIDASTIAGSTGNFTSTVTVPLASIDGINFNTLGGNDAVTVNSVQASLPGGFTITGGTGTDTATINGSIATTGTGAVNITVSQNIALTSGSSISTVNGGVTLLANSGGAAGDFVGIDLDNADVTTSGSGAISVTGTGGNTAGDFGIDVRNGSTISSTDTTATAGTITLNGTGQASGNDGVHITGAGASVSSVNGNISITGNSSATDGVQVTVGAVVQSTGTTGDAATIRIIGNGVQEGVEVSGANAVVQSAAGNIDIDGMGTGTTGSDNIGVHVINGGVIQSTGSATVDVMGTGGNAVATGDGVRVSAANSAITTSSNGNIIVNGQGGSGTGQFNRGVRVQDGGAISSTGTGATAGTITVGGTGGASGTSGNHGISVSGTNSLITSVDGDIGLTGQGGTGSSDQQIGIVLLSGGQVTSTGTGANAADITAGGTGGTGSQNNFGVYIDGSGGTTTHFAAVDGDVSVTGTGGSGGNSNHGVNVIQDGAIQIGTGTMTVTGSSTNGNSNGVRLSTASGGRLLANGAGTITVTATGSGTEADFQAGSDSLIGDGTGVGLGTAASGPVTINADTIDWQGSLEVQSTGALVIQPRTAATTVGLGGGTGTLNLDDTELGFLQNGFSSITIGKSDAGNIDINTASFADPLTLLTAAEIRDNAGTDLNMTSADTATGNGTVAPGQSATAGILNVTGGFAFANSATFDVEIGGNSPGVGSGVHDQIDATGAVTIGTGVTLNTSAFGGFVPAAGDTFEVINRTGGTGTFTGLAEGAQVAANFLGSGLPATISYAGGDGDDVVITLNGSQVNLVGGNLTVSGDGKVNTYVITLVGGNIEIEDTTNPIFAGTGTVQDGPNKVTVPVANVTGTFTVNAGAATDSLEVDFTGTDPTGGLGLTFNGGDPTSNPGDTLSFSNGSFTTTTYNYDNLNDGNVNLDGTVFNYNGLEPITSTITAANVILNYSAAAETITVSDAGGGSTTVNSTLGEITTFVNPTTLLQINAGDTGANIIRLEALVNPYPANIDINGGNGGDSVELRGSNTLSADKSLTVDAGIIANFDFVTPTSFAGIALATSGTGAITFNATEKVFLTDADLSTVNGGITLNGNANGASTVDSTGVDLATASVVTTTGTGAISITGESGTGSTRYGVHIRTGSDVTSTLAAGGGGITINGTSDSASAQSHGVLIENTGTLVDSKSGAISITGNGGPGATSHGVVLLSDADITSSDAAGAATITIIGTGGTGGTGAGLVINDVNSNITSINGDISITATGGATGAGFASAGGTIAATGTAAITITADGDNADAFSIDDQLIGNATGTGTITLTGDEFTVVTPAGDTTVIDGAGALIIQPQTAATTIEIGDETGAGTLNLSDAELGFISDGFSPITIGKADAGDVEINTATFNDPVTILTAGNISDETGTDLTLPASNAVTLNGTVTPGILAPGILNVMTGDAAFADNTTFQVQIGGTTPGEGNGNHDQIDASGSVTIGTNVTLSIAAFFDGGGTNNFVPSQGESYEIINRTGGTGTFVGLAEGALVSSNFLGSGERAAISYVGGDGDDVVVRILPPDVNVNAGALVVNNEAGDINTYIITLINGGADIQIEDTTNPIFAGTGATQVNANTVTVPVGIVSASITFNGQAAADSLEVNRTGGDPTLGLGLTWNGGEPAAADGDILSFTNGTVTTTTVNYTDANSGNVDVDGVVHTFTELEDRAAASGITSSFASANVALNYSTAAETITVTDSGGTSTTVNSAASASTTFTNPTTLLTLNAGDTGVNTIDVGALANPYAGSIDINGGNGGDTVNLNGAITFATDRSLAVDGLTINAPNAASDITASGTGTVALTATMNIALGTGASITTVDGAIDLTANAGGLVGNFHGIFAEGATITSTDGNISLTGTGGTLNGPANAGVYLNDGSIVQSLGTGLTAGIVTLIGNAPGGDGGATDGVLVRMNSQVTSVDGNISITGTSAVDSGVVLASGGIVASTGTGTNAATITINGSSDSAVAGHAGVIVIQTSSSISSVDGSIDITGAGTNSGGIYVHESGSISSTGTGANAAAITLDGDGVNQDGVSIASNGQINSAGGAISIDGTATAADGVQLEAGSTAPLTGTNAATITIVGTGGTGEVGVQIDSPISSGTGAVTIRSEDGGSATDDITFGAAGDITSTSGTITIDADNAGNTADVTMAAGSMIDAGAGAIDIDADVTATLETLTSTVGDITVTSGDVALNAAISSGGALTLEPINAATTIGLGGGAGAFSVDDAELANLTDGFSGITIGKADAGDVTIDTTTFQDPVSLLSAGTFRDATGTDIAAATNAVTLQGTVASGAAATTAGILNVTGNFSFADNDTFEVELGGTSPGDAATDHDQINVTGTVTIGANVTLTTSVIGAFVPFAGDEFIIIDNDGTGDAVTGTFDGLAEGAKIANFLGSGRSATISYVGGDGNDVTLTGDGFFVSLDGSGNLIITDNAGTDDTVTIQADPATMEYVIRHTTEPIGNQVPGGTGTGTMVARVPFAAVTGTQIIANLDGGDDSLNVDYATTNTAFGKLITLNGGESTEDGGGDKLLITGDDGTTVASGIYTPSNTAEAGQHVLTLSAAAGGGTETISFTQLEQSNQVSDIPTYELETGGSNDVLTVAAESLTGPILAATISGTTDLVAIVPITFYDVTSFTIDTGSNDTSGGGQGNDSVTLNSGLRDGTDLARNLSNFSVDTGAAGTGNVDSVTTNAFIDVSGSVTINDAETVDLNHHITSGTGLTISNVGTEIDLDTNIDLTVENGDLNLNTNVTLIDLSGTGSSNRFTANDTDASGDGNVLVGPISDSGTPTTVTLDADNAVTTSSISVQSTITILANQDGTGAETFTQGGDITTTNDTATAVSITVNTGGGGTGNAALGVISAGTTSGSAGGRITVATNGGAITDGNGAANNLTAGNAILTADAGVGTVADPLETTLSRLEATGGTGGVFVTDADSLTIGGIDGGTTGVSSGTGDIDVRTNGGTLTVEENVTSTTSGNILLKTTDTAAVGDDLTVNAGVVIETNTGSIDIQAGDNVTLAATSHLNAPAGTITITSDSDDADPGVGTTLLIAAQLDSTGTSINGGGDDDNYNFFYPDTNSGVNFGTNSGTVTIADTGGTDNVMIHGTDDPESLFLTTADPPTTATTEQVTRGTATDEPVIIPGDIEAVTLLGGEGNDIFDVQPSMLFPVTVNGNNPSFGDAGVPLGDQLDVDTFGNSFTINGKTIFVANGSPNPYRGITFLDIETVPLTPASAGPDQSFDFDDPTNSGPVKTQAGFTSVNPDTLFTAGNFGWQRPMTSFETGTNTGITANYINDGHTFAPTSGADTNTFSATVGNGWVMATIAFGSDYHAIVGMQIENADDNTVIARNLSVAARETDHVTVLVLVQDGTLDLRFRDPFRETNTFRRVSIKGIDLETDGGTGTLGFLSMGFPTPGTLTADGTTVDTFALSAAEPNSLVTVATTLGTLSGTDADPNIQGFQVLTDGSGEASILIRRPSGAGQALVDLSSVTGRKTGCIVIDYGQVAGRNFDFNTNVSATFSPFDATTNPDGYIGVVVDDLFTAERGYGWTTTAPDNFQVSPSVGGSMPELVDDGHIASDARTFRTTLANGTYQVHVTMGAYGDHQSKSISANGAQVVDAQTIVNRTLFETIFTTTVTSGQLDLTFSQNDDVFGSNHWIINALEIRPTASVVAITPPANVGDVDANGTTSTALSFATTAANGTLMTVSSTLGTITTADADPTTAGIQVAVAGGQVSFDLLAGHKSGTPTIEIHSLDGEHRVTANDAALLNFVVPVTRRFDFNNGAISNQSSTAAGFTGVSLQNQSPATTGFGFNENRMNGVFQPGDIPGVTNDDFYRDGIRLETKGENGRAFESASFSIEAKPGTEYDIRVYLGVPHNSFGMTNFDVIVEGAGTQTVGVLPPGTFTSLVFSQADDANGDGFITLTFVDNVAPFDGFSIPGIDIAESATGLPTAAPLLAAEFAAGNPVVAANPTIINNSQLTTVVEVATIAFLKSGLSASQRATLQHINVTVADLDPGVLGLADGAVITIDDDAAGAGWSRSLTDVAADQYDLLTVVGHEIGHALGFDDSDIVSDFQDLMNHQLTVGVRHASLGDIDDFFGPAIFDVTGIGTPPTDPVSSSNAINVSLNDSGELLIDDTSDAGLNQTLTLSTADGVLTISDPGNSFMTDAGTLVSVHQVQVPLSEITSGTIVVDLQNGADILDASGVGASLALNITGGAGNDMITGGQGDDTIDGGTGNDDLSGGGGTDTLLVISDSSITLTLTQSIGDGIDALDSFERAVLSGGAGNDRLDASQAGMPVTLFGSGGDDTLLGGSSNDVLDGGDGHDVAEFVGSSITLTSNAVMGAGDDALTSVEGLQLIANGNGSTIDASAYSGGSVTIVGSSGDDTLTGGAGDDIIIAGSGRDVVSGGDGDDLILGGSGNDNLSGGAGNDTINGGHGRDSIDGGADDDALRGGPQADSIKGGGGNDHIQGDAGADVLEGEDGSDSLAGGAGTNSLIGGAGDDTLNNISIPDSFNAPVGTDHLIGGNAPQARPALAQPGPVTAVFTIQPPSNSVSTSNSANDGDESTGSSDETATNLATLDSAFGDSLITKVLEI